MNNATEINELNRVINSLTCQIKGIAEENDSLHDTINEQHAQINSLTARVWDAECKVIKISDVVGRTDPYYRSTVMESVAAIVTDIPVGSAIQKDGVAAELDSLRTNSEKWEREAHRSMEVITENAHKIENLEHDLLEESESNDEECACLRGVISRLDADNIESRRKFANLKKRDAEHIDHLNAVIFKQKDTIQYLRSTVDKKDSRLAERNNDEEWWAQECESLKDTIVSHKHTIDKLKADRDEWELSLCDACDVIRRFKESS